jgi:hypothetical protein
MALNDGPSYVAIALTVSGPISRSRLRATWAIAIAKHDDSATSRYSVGIAPASSPPDRGGSSATKRNSRTATSVR